MGGEGAWSDALYRDTDLKVICVEVAKAMKSMLSQGDVCQNEKNVEEEPSEH